MINQVCKAIFMLLLISGLAAEVQAGCTVTTTPVSFGIYLGNTNVSSTGTVTTSCDNLTPALNLVVRLDAGSNSNGSFVTRKLKSASNKILNYNLYTDAAHTKIWGDGTNGTYDQQARKLTAYGLLSNGQIVDPGTYNDTVLVTITW